MGTKINPGKSDCYNAALPNEPMFVLLARDPDFERLVREWATNRQRAIFCGDRPESDHDLVLEAMQCAMDGARWRKNNLGSWRAGAAASPAAVDQDDWREDPSADERWNAGLEYGQVKLCQALDVDPALVNWDAATETLDGDVSAVIWNILRAKMGDDWDPAQAKQQAALIESAATSLGSFFSLLRQSSDVVRDAYRLDITKESYEAARKVYLSLKPTEKAND